MGFALRRVSYGIIFKQNFVNGHKPFNASFVAKRNGMRSRGISRTIVFFQIIGMWIIVTTFRYLIDDGFDFNDEVAASLARPGPQCK